MKPTQKLSADQQFFFDHAGYSYNTIIETREQGRTRCAVNLAAAESLARASGVSFQWVPDTDGESHEWGCILRDSQGANCESLWAIGFANYMSPWDGDPYRRVVEAELANEHFAQVMSAANEECKGL